MDKLCLRCIVSGLVQGVWYRASTQEMANKLQLTGWVKNLPDGRVEVLFCGESAAVLQLQEWLWKGPSAAKVTAVESREVTWEDHDGFHVK